MIGYTVKGRRFGKFTRLMLIRYVRSKELDIVVANSSTHSLRIRIARMWKSFRGLKKGLKSERRLSQGA
jgi:hypothetical protein